MEIETPIRQCITLLDKKVRNLEKRKAKLDSLRDKASSGDALDKDQQDAVSKYEVVLQNLDFSRELQKQIQQISNDADKQIKKQYKREKIERQQQEVSRLQAVLKLQSVLDSLGKEQIRNDFKTGTGSKVILTEEDLEQLDDFYVAIVPSREITTNFDDQLAASAEHISSYLDALDKPIAITSSNSSDSLESKNIGKSLTYERLNQLIEGIHVSGYFENGGNKELNQQIEATSSNQTVEETVAKETNQQLEETISNESEMQQWSQGPSYNQHNGQEYEETTNNTYNGDLYQNQAAAAYAIQGNAYASEAYTSQAATIYTNSYRQRPLQEIVSSMQGNYNFLQDSEIDVDGNHVSQIASNNTNHYEAPNTYMHLGSAYPGAGVAVQNHPISSFASGVGNIAPSELQYLEGHRHFAMVVGPPPIPLPNEDTQTLSDEIIFVSKDLRQPETPAEVLNVSTYAEDENIAAKQVTGDIGPRTFAQTAGGAIQNYGGAIRGQQTGTRPNFANQSQTKNLNSMNRGPPRNSGDGRAYSGSGHSSQRPSNNRGQEQTRGYSRSNQMQATA